MDFACQQLSTSSIRPRLKTLLDIYSTINHKISEVRFFSVSFSSFFSSNPKFDLATFQEEFSLYEANDPFVQNFIIQIDSIFTSYKVKLNATEYMSFDSSILDLINSNLQNLLSEGNYDRLITTSTNEVVTIWEKVLLKCGFNRVGVLLFVRCDIDKGLLSYFSWVGFNSTKKFVPL